MIKRLFPIIVVAILILPGVATAQISEEDFWAEHSFLYQFSLANSGGVVTGSYKITTGDPPAGVGPWELVIVGPYGQTLANQNFALSSTATVRVRYQPNGTQARVLNPQGTVALSVDLAGSRVCDEDGFCESQFGEVSTNCPVDCGAPSGSTQTAVIASQSSLGRKVGSILMGMALGAMGILLIRGVGNLLDRRYHA